MYCIFKRKDLPLYQKQGEKKMKTRTYHKVDWTKRDTKSGISRASEMMKEIRDKRDAWARTQGYATYAEYCKA